MTVFRRASPPPPATRTRAVLCIGLALAFASAQAQEAGALQAADPAHAGSAPPPLRLPDPGSADAQAQPADIAAARAIWQRANARVAEFPRGHIDLLRQEAGHTGPAAAPGGASAPPPLDLAQALRLSLRQRPELFTHADMNPLALAQVRVAYAVHVRELQRTWIDAVTTRQRARLLADMLDATRTGSELGRRMVVAGNWSQARQVREQLLEASAWQAAVAAQGEALAAQEQLAQRLGLWDAADVARLGERLPESLPAPPPTPSPGPGLDAGSIEAAALRSHPSLALERIEAQRQRAALGDDRRAAWQRAVDAALVALPDPGSAPTPPHIGDLSLLRDHALERAVEADAKLLRLAAERRAMARQAWAHLQVQHAAALHAQNVVGPLQAALAQETLLRYNGMLQSSWELLASARERLASLDAAQQARRGFWLAQADWQALLAGADYADSATAPSSTGGGSAAPAGH